MIIKTDIRVCFFVIVPFFSVCTKYNFTRCFYVKKHKRSVRREHFFATPESKKQKTPTFPPVLQMI